jgi:integrase/recombinase XerD
LEWLEKEEINNISEVKPHHLITYYQGLKSRPSKRGQGNLGDKGAHTEIHTVRLFFAMLQQENIIEKNPMSVLKFAAPQKESPKKEVLTIPEILEIYRSCESLQEKALISLLYGCGLRNMEARALNLQDLKLTDNYIVIAHGKGNKRRTVPLNGRIRQDLENYITHERHYFLNNRDEKALLLNSKGNRLQKQTLVTLLNTIVKRTGNQAIINKKIRPHHLRHTIATHLLAQGLPIEQVRQFLGHSQLETTELYTRVSEKQLKSLL